MKTFTEKLSRGHDLSRAETATAFEQIMTGSVEEEELCEFLRALAEKGETTEEIVGAASVMRQHLVSVRAPNGAIDTCGTGGDGVSTFNVSTTASIIAAGAGAVVAKHGNRTNTRVSGSAEVLTELGLNLDADVPTLERSLREVGMAFLYAPRLHPAMKHALPARKRLGIRTVFNLLGPLTNPARVRRQVVGVPRADLTETIASALRELGAERAWVVHGADGLCDLSITGPSRVTELRDGNIRSFIISPDQIGLRQAELSVLMVASPAQSAQSVRSILAGTGGPQRDHAVLNAAVALVIADRAPDLHQAVPLAQHSIDSGAAREKLRRLIDVTGGND